MMKILHVATGFPLSYPGGITNYVRSISRAQVIAGNDVHVLAGPGADLAMIPRGVTLHVYESKKLRPFTNSILMSDISSKKLREEILRGNYEIIHVHMALGLAMEFFEFVSSCGIPYVVSLHDYFVICPRIHMVNYTDKKVCNVVNLSDCTRCIGVLDQIDFLRRIVYRLNLMLSGKLTVTLPRIKSQKIFQRAAIMEKFIINAQFVLPVSNRVKEIFVSVFPKGKYQVEHIGNETAHNKDKSKIPSSRIRVVVLGYLNFMKGADVLLHLIKSVKRTDLEFHFYGRAQPIYEKLLVKHGLLCHGSYKPSELSSIMASADLGMVLPVWEDNGPQVVMEFLNYGTPVLGTKRGGIPDFIDGSNGMLFDPSSEKSVAQAVSFLKTITKEKLRHMAESIKQLRTPEEHLLSLNTIYSEAIKRS